LTGIPSALSEPKFQPLLLNFSKLKYLNTDSIVDLTLKNEVLNDKQFKPNDTTAWDKYKDIV